MRAVAVSVWIFINLVFVGMCGYIYLLWSQYWRYVERQHSQMTGIINNNPNSNSYSSNSNSQVFYYYHGSSSDINPNVKPTRDDRTVPKHHLKERRNRTSATIIRRRSQPRFAKLEPDRQLLRCDGNSDSPECVGAGLSDVQPLANYKLSARVSAYKSQLVVQLRRVLLEESSVFKARGDASNPYNVQYNGPRGSYAGRSARELVCALGRAVRVRTLGADDEPFRRLGLSRNFPREPLLGAGGRHYNTCAIVTNAGSLDGARLGSFIDNHDLVLRFNHAPTQGYEHDVGSKTTLRIVNSQVVSKPRFDFLGSPLYRDVALLAWDPSNYSSTLEEVMHWILTE